MLHPRIHRTVNGGRSRTVSHLVVCVDAGLFEVLPEIEDLRVNLLDRICQFLHNSSFLIKN